MAGIGKPKQATTYLLVSLDKQYTAEAPAEPWENYYAGESRVTSGHQVTESGTAHRRVPAARVPVRQARDQRSEFSASPGNGISPSKNE